MIPVLNMKASRVSFTGISDYLRRLVLSRMNKRDERRRFLLSSRPKRRDRVPSAARRRGCFVLRGPSHWGFCASAITPRIRPEDRARSLDFARDDRTGLRGYSYWIDPTLVMHEMMRVLPQLDYRLGQIVLVAERAQARSAQQEISASLGFQPQPPRG